jgi:MHS family proline/betaine transporter-like MFS transporter
LVGEFIFGVFIAMGMAASPKIIASMVPPELRYSTISLGHGMCVALFGGTAPLIVTFLIDKTGSPFAPTYYIIITAITTLLFALKLKTSMKSIVAPEVTENVLKLIVKSEL